MKSTPVKNVISTIKAKATVVRAERMATLKRHFPLDQVHRTASVMNSALYVAQSWIQLKKRNSSSTASASRSKIDTTLHSRIRL